LTSVARPARLVTVSIRYFCVADVGNPMERQCSNDGENNGNR
jgi:hypothetical protein